MIISALILSLADDPVVIAEVMRTLESDPSCTLGALFATTLPVVTETADLRAGEAHCEGLAAVPGVLRVDVVRIDDVDEPDGPALVMATV